jgi:putative ABC transport system ATP-binding protein
MTNAPIIETRGLKKTYRQGDLDVLALRGVDVQVKSGEFLAIIGPSGSGKSTLFHILGGLTPATEGDVLINGKELRGMSEAGRTELRRTTVSFVFQKYNLLPTLSVRDNIEIARDIAHKKGPLDATFLKALDMLGIGHRLDLSGGEQQRVAIARAIVNHPAILLADEPTGNLDTENSNNVLGVLRDLNHTIGQTILMITHNPEAAAFADRIIEMRDGRVVSHGVKQ